MKVSAKELQDIYGVDRRTITNWLNMDPPCPSAMEKTRRVFDLGLVAKWREAWAERRGAETAPAPADLEEAKVRRESALAQQEELKLEQMRRSLMTTAQFERQVADVAARFDAKLQNLPQRIAAVNWASDMAERVKQARPLVDEIRSELHKSEDVPEEAA